MVLAIALLAAISGVVHLPETIIFPAFFAVVFAWGFVGWGFLPAQSSHLLSLSPTNAPLVLSLNASALYLGIAGGSLIGGLVLENGTASDLGWVGALFPAAALVLMVLRATGRERVVVGARLG